MPRWGIFVEPPAHLKEWDRVLRLAEVDGNRDEAEAELLKQVYAYRPKRPTNPRDSTLYRLSDGWLLLIRGASGAVYPHRFLLGEEYGSTTH